MASDDFHPKLGRIRARPGAKNQRYLNKVIQTMRKASAGTRAPGRSTFVGSRSGRGYFRAFPAHAGMNRSMAAMLIGRASVPRPRGDEPRPFMGLSRPPRRSPPTRG